MGLILKLDIVDFIKAVIGFESLGVTDFGVEKLLMFFLRRIVNVFCFKNNKT